MSLIKSATRRLSLLAGSSLVAASLSAAASVGLALTPTVAFAYDECAPTPSSGTQTDGPGGVSDPTLNGTTTADSFTCAVATYPSGIRYTSAGDLSVIAIGGQISPSATSNYGTGGVVATGVGGDDVTLRMTGVSGGPLSFNAQPFPVLLDAQSQSGDILVDLALTRANQSSGPFPSANNAATRRFVRAVSTAGGDVTVTNSQVGANFPDAAPTGSITATGAADAAAIEARSIGGGDVTVDMREGTATGRLYGIIAQADGAGAVSITGRGSANNSAAGSAGLHVTAGTGLVTITSTSSGSFSGRTGVYVNSGGDVAFTGGARGTDYGIDLVNVAAGSTATIDVTGGDEGGAGLFSGVEGGIAAIRASGAGEVLVNVSGIQEQMNFDFTGMAAPVEVTFVEGGLWRTRTGLTVSAGNFGVTIEPGAGLVAGPENNGALQTPTVITFADPDFVLTNEGFVIVGPWARSHTAGNLVGNLWFEGLGEFRHSGTVVLGAFGGNSAVGHPQIGGNWAVDTTDGVPDDILTMVGGTWVGEEGRVMFDVDFNRSQADCTRDPVTGSMAAADCLRLPGVTTEGVTYVTINEIFPGDRIRPPEEGIVLVEVTGGTSAQGHFTIDPDAIGHTDLFGGSQDRGLYHYVIGYNEETQQHSLFGFVGAGSYQFAQYATAAHSLWRLSTGTWLERQADLRDRADRPVGGGAWMRVSGEVADRDSFVDNVGGGRTFTFDHTHQQTSYAVTGGLDLISAEDGDRALVAGLMTGYTYSDVEYDAWNNTGQFDGFNVGAYTSVAVGGMFLDAAINANRLILKNDMPGLNIFPAGSILDTVLVTTGAQVEAGWRLPVGGSMFVEPLVSGSIVRSRYDDLEVSASDPIRPGVDIEFDDPTSARASIGGRAGLEQDFGFARAEFTVLGRLWNEFEGENTVLINNQGVIDEVVDDFSGQFNELGLGAIVTSPGGAVSGFLNLGGKFGDDYQAKTGSVGVRVAW